MEGVGDTVCCCQRRIMHDDGEEESLPEEEEEVEEEEAMLQPAVALAVVLPTRTPRDHNSRGVGVTTTDRGAPQYGVDYDEDYDDDDDYYYYYYYWASQ